MIDYFNTKGEKVCKRESSSNGDSSKEFYAALKDLYTKTEGFTNDEKDEYDTDVVTSYIQTVLTGKSKKKIEGDFRNFVKTADNYKKSVYNNRMDVNELLPDFTERINDNMVNFIRDLEGNNDLRQVDPRFKEGFQGSLSRTDIKNLNGFHEQLGLDLKSKRYWLYVWASILIVLLGIKMVAIKK